MKKIAVVYWSGTGNTEAMANAIAEGVNFNAGAVAGYDAIAFGCPAMGSEELEDSEFEPMFAGVEGALSGKTVALFGSCGWGDGQWLRDWAERCVKDGAAVVDMNGLHVMEAPDADGIAACQTLGKQIAG